MASLDYDDAAMEIRADIKAAHARTWRRIGAPGTWFDGRTRVAIAAETRHAEACSLCAARKAALSPFAVDGVHDSLGALPDNVVEVVHRIVTDPGRLTQGWYRKCLETGLTDAEYVEIVGVACSTLSVDTFARAVGVARRDLPEPQAGAPSKVRPAEASQGPAWVPWIAGPDARGDDIPNFGPGASNVRRSLSLVPADAHGFFDLVAAQYLEADQMKDIGGRYRAIDRAQIELIAGRISFLNQCAY